MATRVPLRIAVLLSLMLGSLTPAAAAPISRDDPETADLTRKRSSTTQQAVRQQSIGSGTALVQWINGRWHGAADPRREGSALALP